MWKPLRRIDGYLPIEDHGLIGNGATAALVGRDGALSWLCVPRFDSPPLFCNLLDAVRGGVFAITPESLLESRQFYEPDTAVLVTEVRTRTGMLRVTDLFPLSTEADLVNGLHVTRHELLRSATVLEGTVHLQIIIDPRGGAESVCSENGIRLQLKLQPDCHLSVGSTIQLKGSRTALALKTGESIAFLLCWTPSQTSPSNFDPKRLYEDTVTVWQTWLRQFKYDGPQAPLVRRAAITLKLLDYIENGAIIAAPTSSLPELIGGVRNWDYRYCWVRDTAYSVYALHRIGFSDEADKFLAWILDAAERDGTPRVAYTLDGQLPPEEHEDITLEGYRRSRPVRWGNDAAPQRQHDVYGEVLDCAYQLATHQGKLTERRWTRLLPLVEAATKKWREPGRGIWEVRTDGRPFTYSTALCQVALDRAARLAERFRLPGPHSAWRCAATEIGQAIVEESWDPRRKTITAYLGGGGIDASLLALPLRRVLQANHPKMVATTHAISERLGAGQGLLYRYLPDELPDGIAGQEGAFLLCSFWLVDNLTMQGQLDEALASYDSLCGRAGELGLLPEEIDPSTGAFLGNYPQALSHVGLISSGVNLAYHLKRAGRS